MDIPNFNDETEFQVEDEFSDSMLKYINQVLMEEDIESKPCMFQDRLTLQATEESLYEVIRDPIYVDQNVKSPDVDFSYGNCSDFRASSGESAESQIGNPEFIESSRPSILQNPIRDTFVFQSNSRSKRSPFLWHGNEIGNGNGVMGSYRSEALVSDVLSKKELQLMFNLGAEEGSKFIPKGQLICAEGNKANTVAEDRKAEDDVVGSVGLGRKKNRQREDERRRSNKQSAVYLDNEEEELLSDVFDKVLLGRAVSEDGQFYQTEEKHGLKHDEQSVGIGNEKARENKEDVIDLRALLISCAQAVSVDDRETAIELLKQIMQHSSPFGDCSQRLAYCFGNALQARLAGTGTQIYTALSLKRLSAADMLKFFQAYLAACPLMKMSMIFANDMILKAAEKAETLHIIDFGILYGFQWPAFIHGLSRRPGGPPRLRITGVELPLSGFRPEERVQETGHRLARYCKRFNVPFEYYAIAKKWETVQFEDLKVQRNEVLAVNCTCRFKNLLDETIVVNSPRDIVLKLIRNLNPDVFVQTVVNGSYHAPFFVPRFREALNHFSALFDMFDTHLPREDQMRLGFEKEFIGREVLNIVACEGPSRIVRPETYKKWQVRHMRAGFRQLPLDREVVKNIKDKIRTGYHPGFVADEDGYWLLHGWKGRIIYASACWTPSRT